MAVSAAEHLSADGGLQPASIHESMHARLAVGEFAPGSRLKPDELRKDYNCSASAMREALFRLSCAGTVDFEEQRGFRVPQASLQRLLEVRHLRVLIEAEGAALSIERGDMVWEARVAAAHHKLAHIETRMNRLKQVHGHIVMWTQFDWEFHDTLVSACGSALLRETLRNLFFMYRQQLVGMVGEYGFRKGTSEEHKAILDAALERDADKCAEMIRRHFSFLDRLAKHRDSGSGRGTTP